MDEFVFPARCSRRKAAEKVYHAACDWWSDPDVAVYDPDNVSLCFSVCPAHVPYLGVGPEVGDSAIAA